MCVLCVCSLYSHRVNVCEQDDHVSDHEEGEELEGEEEEYEMEGEESSDESDSEELDEKGKTLSHTPIQKCFYTVIKNALHLWSWL